eukprot:7165593-Pyramimonas_sp.AAC.1
MFAVLNAMNVPSFSTNFYIMLYKNNQGAVTLGGQKFRSFPIQRGVRQGDPSSMALVCLCIDPVLRWIQQTLPAHVALCLAYADDCLFGMVDVFRSTTAVWCILLVLESAIGLALNFRKCT